MARTVQFIEIEPRRRSVAAAVAEFDMAELVQQDQCESEGFVVGSMMLQCVFADQKHTFEHPIEAAASHEDAALPLTHEDVFHASKPRAVNYVDRNLLGVTKSPAVIEYLIRNQREGKAWSCAVSLKIETGKIAGGRPGETQPQLHVGGHHRIDVDDRLLDDVPVDC